MSSRRDDRREISLVLNADRVPAKGFLAVLENFVKAVERVSAEVNPERETPALELRVAEGSQAAYLSGAPQVDPAVIALGFDAFAEGLERLSQPGTESPPPGFNDEALKALGYVARATQRMRTEARIEVGVDRLVPLTRQLVSTIKAVRAGGYTMLGSYEGRLELVNVHDPKNRRCYIYPLHRKERVLVTFEEEQFEMVRDNLDKRVIAAGKLYYDDDDRIKRLELRTITRIKDEHELPSIRRMAGILAAR